jgi:NAD(P)H-quinone oxidoreductase subunit 2
MRPLQVGLVLSLVATSLAGILSNPLFTLANNSITNTSTLQPAVVSSVGTQANVNQTQPLID